MKILELNFEKSWRGGERQTLYAMQGFRDAGFSVRLICRKGFPMEQEALSAGFAVHAFDSILGVIFFLISQGRKFDFIHAQTSQILTYCVFTKIFHRAKVLFTRRVNFVQRGFFTKLKYQLTDKIVVISNPVRETVSAFSGRNDIEVIPDIVMKKELNVARAKDLLSKLNTGSRFIVATTAAMTKEKDPFTLIESIKKLSEKRNDFIFFHFGSGNLHDAIAQKIKEYNLQHCYFLMGFVENVEDFFSQFQVFVMTSKEEGLGSSVLDAFIYKVPVVSTDAGGLSDLMNEGRGIRCEAEDSGAIAAGIGKFLSDTKEKEKCIENAFEYVSQYHNTKHITNQYIQLMKFLTPHNA